MSRYPIPEAVLARHIACVGETGSGKTYDTKSIVEHLVAEGHRVCVLDTIKSDWWGMISSASGKKGGLPFRIIGGPRGHVPLHAGAGKALGELVAKGKLPLSIIDMADFGPGDPQRFFEAFAQAIWKNIKGVLYLVIEEAHEIAPKERAGFGKENMSVYWAKRLATGSRTKGIRLIVATQRVQALHNAVLGSCGTLAAHSLSFPADQKPVIDWLNNNIKDKAIRSLINEEMASLPAGHAWVACPKEGFIEKVHFPAIKTFDNTATPDKDAADIHVATAAVDPDELRAIIGDAVKEAEENDPGLLKRRLVSLEAELAKLRKSPAAIPAVAPAPTTKAIHDARTEGHAVGHRQGYDAGHHHGFDQGVKLTKQAFRSAFEGVGPANLVYVPPTARPAAPKPPAGAQPPAPTPQRAPAPVTPAPRAAAPVNGNLKPSLQRAIDAIAWWRKIGKDPVERDRAAVVAGFSPRASTFGVYIAELVQMGLVQVTPGFVSLTTEGGRLANIPDASTAEDLKAAAANLLKSQERRVFNVVYDAYPEPIRRDAVAEAVGLSPTASTAGVYIAGVAAYGIIEAAGPGQVRAADWLFPEGA